MFRPPRTILLDRQGIFYDGNGRRHRLKPAAGGSTGKILRGQITLSVRHLLAILDAAGIPWAAFFQVAYPLTGQQGPSLEVPPELPKARPPATAPQPAPAAAAIPATTEPDRPLTEGDRQILALLRRLVQLAETDEAAEPQA